MRNRTIPLLALSFLVLLCLYYFDYRHRVERHAAAVHAARALPFAVETIDLLEVRNRSGHFQLQLRRDGWWITQPVVERADQKAVADTVLAALAEARRSGSFPVDREERAQYGLGEDAIRVRAESGAARQAVELVLGSETPIQGEMYFCDSASPLMVHVTPLALRKVFERPLLDFRDRSVLDFPSEQAAQVEIFRPQGVLFFRPDGGKPTGPAPGGRRWLVGESADRTVPQRFHRADPARVAEILQSLQSLAPVDASVPGLSTATLLQSRPVLAAWVGLPGGDPAQALTTATASEISFYAIPATRDAPATSTAATTGTLPSAPVRDGLVALAEGKSLLFRVPDALGQALRQPAAAFRDRQLLSLEPAAICYLQIEMRIRSLGTSVALTRDPGGPWRYAAENGVAVNQERVALYLAYCLGQQVDSYLLDPPATSTLAVGLEPPLLRVTIATADRRTREGFEIGSALEAGSPLFHARRVGTEDLPPAEAVFTLRLSQSLLLALMKPEGHFQDRSILPASIASAARIDIVSRNDDGTTLTLIREPGGDQPLWHAELNRSGVRTVPGLAVAPLLDSLRSLEYTREIQEPDPRLLAEYGMDSPRVAIRLADPAGKPYPVLHLGRSAKRREESVVRVGADRYYSVPTAALETLSRAVEELAGRLR